MNKILRVVSHFALKFATQTYSLRRSMMEGPEFLEISLPVEVAPSRYRHIFSNRMLTRGSDTRGAYLVSNATVVTRSGNIYWRNLLIEESSTWPAERVNLTFETATLRPRTILDERVMVPLPASSYYHWLIEDLPAALFMLENASGSLPLVPVKRPRYLDEFLKIRGGEFMEFDGAITVPKVAFLGKQGIIGNPQPRDLLTLREFAHNFVLSNQAAEDSRSLVYISRRSASRSPEWEPELISRLQELGAQIVELERLSWPDQILIFSTASIVVGIHGAGLANIAFCRPETRVLELLDEAYPNNCFEILAEQVGLNFDRLIFNGNVFDRDHALQLILKWMEAPY